MLAFSAKSKLLKGALAPAAEKVLAEVITCFPSA